MNTIEIALQKAGLVEKQDTESCWACNSPLPEIHWIWPDVIGPRFCSESCCSTTQFDNPDSFNFKYFDDIKAVLDAWQLPYDKKFLSPDGLVIVSLLCNAAAKEQHDWICPSLQSFPDFYDFKPGLIEAAARRHTHVWKQNDGDAVIVYFETCVGQISFHVFPEESEFFHLLPDANGREWRGGWMQDEARAIALAFLGNGDDILELDLRRFLAQTQDW